MSFESNKKDCPSGSLFFFGDPAATRTQDLLLRRQLLYPAELRGHLFLFVGTPRFELGISCSQSRRDNRTSLYPAFMLPHKKRRLWASFSLLGGEGGIRTPGTLIEYDSLANCWFQPLTHLSVSHDLTKKHRFFVSQKRCKSTNIFQTDQIFFSVSRYFHFTTLAFYFLFA